MENEARRRGEAEVGGMGEDSGVPPELFRVRALLRALPTVSCPHGFEIRLERRIRGEAGTREVRVGRSWSLGWLGVGLGFAAALAVGAFVFDFSFTGPVQAPLASLPPAAVTNTGAPTQYQAPEGVTEQAVSASSSVPGQSVPALASQAPQQPPAKKDSTPTQKATELPENLYQTVGGNNR